MKKIITLFYVLVALQSFSQIKLSIDNKAANNSETFKVYIKVADFDDVLSMQSSLNWDPTELEFIEVGDFNCSNLSSTDFGKSNVASGQLTMSWVEENLTGVTYPDGTSIFSLSFKAIGSGVDTNVSFSDSPLATEIYNETLNELTLTQTEGVISISEKPLDLSSITIKIPNAGMISEKEVEFAIHATGLSTDLGIKNITFSLSFGSGMLTYLSNITTGTISAGKTVSIDSSISGIIKVEINSTGNISGTGNLIKLRLSILKDGDSPILLKDFKINNNKIASIKGVNKFVARQLKWYGVKMID